MSYYSEVMRCNPIRYMRGSAIDSSSQGQNATLSGGVSSTAGLLKGTVQQSLNFNTTGYYSSPSTGLPIGAQPWTMECWSMFPSLSGLYYDVIINIGQTVSNAHSVAMVYFDIGSNKWAIGFSSGDDITGGSLTVVANTVYYLVATYDGTTASLCVRGNGTQSLISGTIPLNIAYGALVWGNDDNAGLPYHGISQEFAVYNYVLSTDQQMRHYRVGQDAGILQGNYHAFGEIR